VLARPLAVSLVLVCLIAACGTERNVLPDPNAELESVSLRTVNFPRAGMSLRAPKEFRITRRPAPAVFRFTLPSGAVVSGLAYRRKEPLPRTPAELGQARKRLVAATKKRDPRFELDSSRVMRAGGAPGVEVLGTQTLSGGRLQTRSVHLFRAQTEYVLELIAPRRDFGPADSLVFSPMLRSLELTGARAP